jgi:ABC-type bacteriocin/lantibiotic exporter with double-glycine peptidase domain
MMANWMRPRIERFLGVARQAVGSLFGLGVNWLSEIQFAQDYNLEEVAREATDTKSKEVARTALAATWFAATAVTANTLVNSLFQVSVLALGGLRVLGGHLTLGQLLAFQIYAAMLSGPVQRLLQTATLDSASLMPFYDRISPLFAAEAVHPRGAGALQETVSHRRQIASLALMPGQYCASNGLVFDIPEIHIQQGQVLSIAGENAVGKTTLLRSLVRDSAGRLLRCEFRDLPMDDSGLRSRRLLAYMAQKPAIAPGTLLENLTLFAREPDLDRVKSICATLALAPLVSQLPKGLHSELTPMDMVRFSGGELRRIGLARVLYQEPEIILIDEPTAGLDHASRKVFHDVLQRLALAGKILLLITHEPELEGIADITLRITPDSGGIRRCVLAACGNIEVHQNPLVVQSG